DRLFGAPRHRRPGSRAADPGGPHAAHPPSSPAHGRRRRPRRRARPARPRPRRCGTGARGRPVRGARLARVDPLTGLPLLTPGQARFDDLIENIDADADEFVDQLNPAGSATVFADLDYDADPNLTTTVRRLTHLATAWATPGSRHHDDATRRDIVTDGLRVHRARH